MVFAFTVMAVLVRIILCDVIDEPEVTIDQGVLRGSLLSSIRGSKYYAFKGIPYAKPPIGDLKFMPPQPPDPWNGTRLAYEDGNMCVQRAAMADYLTGEEDCLYLNVYTLKLYRTNNDKKMPVMVWLHGGSFNTGSGTSAEYTPEFLVAEGVVVVTLNYRLGLWGFLKAPRIGVSGNAGLQDQVEAFRWIQRNIAAFSGDDKQVTLFGWSAGAASIHFHMLSPELVSKGLFHRVILQSGTAINPWALNVHPEIWSTCLLKNLGLYNNKTTALRDLQNTPRYLLFKRQPCPEIEEKYSYGIYPFTYLPSPERISNNDNSVKSMITHFNLVVFGLMSLQKQIPMMIGYTSKEGNLYQMPEDDDLKEVTERASLENNIRLECLAYYMESNRYNSTEITKKIYDRYYGKETNAKRLFEISIDLTTDCSMLFGIENTVRHYTKYRKNHGSSKDNIYYYRFSFDGSFGMTKKEYGLSFVKGASHGDDLGYLFHWKGPGQDLYSNSTLRERKMMRTMIKMWTNFAKNGNPTPEVNADIPIKWIPVIENKIHILDIKDDMRILKNINNDIYNFYVDFA